MCFIFFLLIAFGTIEGHHDRKPLVDTPYLLPEDHPLKPIMDDIFSHEGVLKSSASLFEVGFDHCIRSNKGLLVGFHPDLKGYLVKGYTERNKGSDLSRLVARIEGARLIQEALDRYGYNDILKVPKKWLYKLPKPGKRKYVLLVEDMEIVTHQENAHFYKTVIEQYQLDALFDIIMDCKLTDSVVIINIPFSLDGRIAFVDTEYAGRSRNMGTRPARLARYLSDEQATYWLNKVESSLELHEGKGERSVDLAPFNCMIN